MPESTENADPATQVASQYHHFIPRFILKNFAHPFRPDASKARRRRKKGPRPGEPMLYTIDLARDGDIIEAPVSKSFGLTDMYRDLQSAGNQHHLEQGLSRLESEAGRIIANIRKKHDAGSSEVWMSRKDRDTLRKFLFIMKYRSSGFHKRFQARTAEEYCADDKEFMLKYMREKGFIRPVDVWFDNINAILDLKMGLGNDWAAELQHRMYPGDATWAFINIQAYYLAICTPTSQDDEFLLSENLFSIHEGPNDVDIDVDSGEEVTRVYTEYHVFAVISPRLMMVLRSNFLPDADEDMNEAIKKSRESVHNLCRALYKFPSEANSALEDLPIRRASNSYTKKVGGQIYLLPGEDGSPRAHHRFGFPFFPIGTEHINIINSVILQQAYSITSLCFVSKSATRKTLEWYLATAEPMQESFAAKVSNSPVSPRLACIEKLAHAARSLGSDNFASYSILTTKREEIWDQLDQGLRNSARGNQSGLSKAYLSLGGTGMTLMYDMEQAGKMKYLRIKIDVWSRGLDGYVRDEIRENLADLFCKLPSRRLYLYMKQIRHMVLSKHFVDNDLQAEDDGEALTEGPEDAIAQAAQVFSESCISRMLYHATLNDVAMAGESLRRDTNKMVTVDVMTVLLDRVWRTSLFRRAGSICDCGIEIIETKSREAATALLASSQRHDGSRTPILSSAQNREEATRLAMQAKFTALLEGKLPEQELEALKKALFGTVFPTICW